MWLGVSRILRPEQSKYARRMWDTVFRLPFRPNELDQRPVARAESADPPVATVQSHPLNQTPGSVEAQLQELYDAAAPMLTDVGAVGRRSKLTDLPASIFTEAIASIASRVHPADLLDAAKSLDWPSGRVSSLEQAIAAMRSDTVLDVAMVTALPISGASTSDKQTLFTNASTSLTPRDLVDYFNSNARLRGALARGMDAVDLEKKLEAGKAIVEKWYDREMDRLSALYRRQNRKVLLVLAIPVVLFFRANTIGTVRDLNHDAALRDALANNAVSATAGSTLEDAVKNSCEPATSDSSVTTEAPALAAPTTIDPFNAAVDRFSCAGKIVREAETFGFTPAVGDLLHPNRWSMQGGWHWVVDDYGVIGRAITLVALMFGAQFWFDALRRLVGIRSKLTGAGSASG